MLKYVANHFNCGYIEDNIPAGVLHSSKIIKYL